MLDHDQPRLTTLVSIWNWSSSGWLPRPPGHGEQAILGWGQGFGGPQNCEAFMVGNRGKPWFTTQTEGFNRKTVANLPFRAGWWSTMMILSGKPFISWEDLQPEDARGKSLWRSDCWKTKPQCFGTINASYYYYGFQLLSREWFLHVSTSPWEQLPLRFHYTSRVFERLVFHGW